MSTYDAFVDFIKAHDSINRDLLWQRLIQAGVGGKMLKAVQSLYKSLSSCIRTNGLTTDLFDVNAGLRQGCRLSLLFNCFINALAKKIKAIWERFWYRERGGGGEWGGGAGNENVSYYMRITLYYWEKMTLIYKQCLIGVGEIVRWLTIRKGKYRWDCVHRSFTMSRDWYRLILLPIKIS